MVRSQDNIWLGRFALFTALATLALIALGGLVTSHGVGMSVPDWPTTYGYNMFLFPPSLWVGGIFYEHTHRLAASAVGLLTAILAVWLWLKESRSWLRWLGVLAFFAVVLQGVLGGLRVVLFKDALGIFHAALAQAFLVLLFAIALFTSRWWQNLPQRVAPVLDRRGLRLWLMLGAVLILAQLVLGATMRHQHAGLAIPDFPLAYHKLWPPMDADSIAAYNRDRHQVSETKPITAFQIGLQMAHRLLALVILLAVSFSTWSARRQLGSRHPVTKLSHAWLALIVFQIILGAATILSNKAADVATLHVVAGAASLVLGALLTVVSFRVLIPAHAAIPTMTKTASRPFPAAQSAAPSAKC